MIEATNITKSYGSLQVLKGININIQKAEVVSIVGASGAGKSTLLQILGTLDKADNGSLKINDTNLEKLNDNQLSDFRNKHIGFIFQFHHLLPEFTALENICIPAFIAKKNKKDTEHKAKELLGYLNLLERANHKPSQLSGGEQQRVAVARSLINSPSVILADEPSGNLDSLNAKELHDLFFNLREKFQQTFVIVTHNKDLADMADRKLTMRDGFLLS
ncbi:MAG: lipoprotein ABC transporter ATP-binding protein [Bacteroidetes bacterium RIFCSPLOWO2_12_FULL_31_6]|nr:MAG: lipoprotein ABC transporter ATP-binding protein [Bacteroidetes bacterium RIFCSPLOWO2_12_FULL_31_6]